MSHNTYVEDLLWHLARLTNSTRSKTLSVSESIQVEIAALQFIKEIRCITRPVFKPASGEEVLGIGDS